MCCCILFCFFFFKQKTAYEMRISDWSSDVCSSDLYEFLKWGSKALDNFKVVPPGTGICHQVNLENIAQAVWTSSDASGATVAYPDTCVGTDSHTTMVNGLGVLGWGVGGIEAEAAMLGRSEEHTSELQSLMRISYAVF